MYSLSAGFTEATGKNCGNAEFLRTLHLRRAFKPSMCPLKFPAYDIDG